MAALRTAERRTVGATAGRIHRIDPGAKSADKKG